MNRTKVGMIQGALKDAFGEIEKKFNVKVNIGGASYTDNDCTVKVGFADVLESGEVYSREKEDFKKYATSYGLSPEDLGQTFSTNGHEYRISGLSISKPKYPILARRITNGKGYKFTTDQVKLALLKKIA